MLTEHKFIYPNFPRNLHAVLQLCASMEWGLVCPTGTIPCPVDTTNFLWHWPHHHLPQTSFHTQHVSGVQRGENL